MKQQALAIGEFERFRKPTRHERFLAEMDKVVPWKQLAALIEPHYPKAGRVGARPAAGLEKNLRIHRMQLWFDLSDPPVEEALCDSRAMRTFVGTGLGREPVPDEMTVMRFRHSPEENNLGTGSFEEVAPVLMQRGLHLSNGAMVDATIIAAPSSTKNADKESDPQMHQTKKGNRSSFGMKSHFGRDSQSKVIRSVAVTPANTADSKVGGNAARSREAGLRGPGISAARKSVSTASAHRRCTVGCPVVELSRLLCHQFPLAAVYPTSIV